MPLSIGARRPELAYLDVFYAVCVEGGFTAAARHFGCSQPAISYQIRALERTLGARLIERGGRRVLLTPAGERVKAYCHDFFGELARVRAECAGGVAQEPLRLGSASGFGRYVLMPTLVALADARGGDPFPLQVMFDAADVVLARLERGEDEAAFVYTRTVSNRLRSRAVYDEELVLIAPPQRRSAFRVGVLDRLSAIEPLPFVTYEESEYVFGRWFDATFDDQPDTVRSVARFSELEEVIDFVRRGAGLSIVPRDSAEAARIRGEVDVIYAGRGTPCLNQVFMVVRAGSIVRPELQRLAAALRARNS